MNCTLSFILLCWFAKNKCFFFFFFFYTKLSCRNIGEIARRCLLSKKLPQLSWPNVTLRNTCITVHGHFQLFLFFSSTSYDLQQVTTLRPCKVQVQWRRKQFASGGHNAGASKNFWCAPRLLLCPPHEGHNDCLLPTEWQLKCPPVSALQSTHLLVKSGEGQ